jgi:hypothetical protein
MISTQAQTTNKFYKQPSTWQSGFIVDKRRKTVPAKNFTISANTASMGESPANLNPYHFHNKLSLGDQNIRDS